MFAVDPDPGVSARRLHDKHVVKMTLETAQMLGTALRKLGLRHPSMYAPTHPGHPCVVWAGRTRGNFDWLARHGLALSAEYTRRYGRVHASSRVISALGARSLFVPDGPLTPHPQCVPLEFRCDDPYRAYRAYLRWKYDAWRAGRRS